MRKIINIAVLALFGLAVLSSCSKEDDPLFGDVDYNAPGYAQFGNSQFYFEFNKLDGTGAPSNYDGVVTMKILGPPSDVDRTIGFTVSDRGILTDDDGNVVMIPATTAMYTLAANSFTIPAGGTSGSVGITLVNLELPLEELVYIDIELSEGGDVNLADVATETSVTMFKKDFCPLVNGVADLAGTWSGVDGWYTADVTTAVVDDDIAISGLSTAFMENWWAETVMSGGTVTMTVDLASGTVNIPRQYLYTTDYNGSAYDYEIEGAGTWFNCGANPTLTIIYDVYYPGESTGLAGTYYPAYLPAPYLTADIVMDPAPLKSGNSFAIQLPKPDFK